MHQKESWDILLYSPKNIVQMSLRQNFCFPTMKYALK